MLIGIAYLALFLAAGLLLARWAVPDGSPAVAVPLGCGFRRLRAAGRSFAAGGAARRVRAGVRLHAAGRLACGCRGRPALRGIDFCRARTYPFC